MPVELRHRPNVLSKKDHIWAIASELYARNGRLPLGRTVVDAYLHEDPLGNEGTAFTQYSHWKKQQEQRAMRPVNGGLSPSGARIIIGPNGQIALSPELLQRLGLTPGDVLLATDHDGELRMVAAKAALHRAQAIVRQFDTGAGSVVDELLADRRREALSE